MNIDFLYWTLFSIIVACLLAIDIYATDHRHGKISIKTSLFWSAVWIVAAILYGVFIDFLPWNGKEKTIEFFTGYLLEKSLSVDNLFVFFMIFSLMDIKNEAQPHILKWGIISAIVMRVFFILFGVMLLEHFHFVMYIFGVILLWAAWKMAFGDDSPMDVRNNFLVKLVGKKFSLLHDYQGEKFLVKRDGKWHYTSLLVTLLMIESADLVFALDSIPAVIAITRDPFIIITSNIFAILGLRALYFALAGFAELFAYLKYGIGVILVYVGFKMITTDIIHIPALVSLLVILGGLTISIIASVIANLKAKKKTQNEIELV